MITNPHISQSARILIRFSKPSERINANFWRTVAQVAHRENDIDGEKFANAVLARVEKCVIVSM